jgi:hypothetical protein
MTSNLGATFNDFLFATVCKDRNEMPLSVVSALARLDLDPWTEAAELARMPADGAARRLSSWLAEVIDEPALQTDRATLAARLIALLPMAVSRDASRGALTAGFPIVPHARTVETMILVFLASMAVSVLIGNLAPGGGMHGAPSAPSHSTAARR